MFVAAAEENTAVLSSDRGDAYCGMLNASYNLKLRGINAYIPEYPVGDAQAECAEMIARIRARSPARLLALKDLKIISFGPRPLRLPGLQRAHQAPLFNLGVNIQENSELDLFEAYKEHAGDPAHPRR